MRLLRLWPRRWEEDVKIEKCRSWLAAALVRVLEVVAVYTGGVPRCSNPRLQETGQWCTLSKHDTTTTRPEGADERQRAESPPLLPSAEQQARKQSREKMQWREKIKRNECELRSIRAKTLTAQFEHAVRQQRSHAIVHLVLWLVVSAQPDHFRRDPHESGQ